MSSFQAIDATITAGAVTLDAVRFYYGLDHRPIRRDVDGWGTSIELAAVIQLLDEIATGTVELATVRQTLAQSGQALEKDFLADPAHGYASPQALRCVGDCDRCRANEPTLRKIYAQALARWQRFQHPDDYPYAVSGRSAHRISCREVRNSMRAATFALNNDGTLNERVFRSELHQFTHADSRPAEPRQPLTADEFDRWRHERIGPQGGLRYQLCKICDPDVPLA